MKLSTIALNSVFLVSSMTSATPSGSTCGDYANLSVDLAADCTSGTIVNDILEPIFEDTKPASCSTTFARDLKILTQTETTVQARDYLDSLCAAALALTAATGAPSADWTAIENAKVDLVDFFGGGGFLNLETGNFHQDALDADSYYYTGTDPRENDHYPTTEASYQAGVAIDSFLTKTADAYYLNDPMSFSTCGLQAVMCCWHRDRQYKDNNGGCNAADCFDKDPADNTDLCWTEDNAGNPTPYPGNAEGSIHCHGFAWSDLLDDVNSDARWNNLFYVAMHDHMYTRGYVESITNDPNIANVQPMCGCIEDMNPVARADCTEAAPTTEYTLNTDSNEVLSIVPTSGTYRVEFQACEGYIYNSAILPEDYDDALVLQSLNKKDNDLSAFVYRMYLEEKVSLAVMETIFEDHLVGYEDPNTNNNQAACKAAYETKFGQVYLAA